MDYLSTQSYDVNTPVAFTQPTSPKAVEQNDHGVTPPLGQTRIFVLGRDADLVKTMQCKWDSVQVALHAKALLDQMTHLMSGCVVVDCDSIDVNVAELTSLVWRHSLAFPIIAVIGPLTKTKARDWFRAGAFDVLFKPFAGSQLQSAVQAAYQCDGEGSFSPRLLRTRLASLTSREREILGLCLQGTPAKVLASQLGVTFQTVDKHRARALKKIGVGSLLELAHRLSNALPSSPTIFF